MRDSRLFDKIGPAKLREVIEDFYSRIFGDVMIGFLFEGKDRARLVEMEYQFTAQLLGGDIKYAGRSMREAHARSPIFGGHFERRLQILRETLRDQAVDPEVVAAWIDHTLSLRAQITSDQGSECKNTSVAKEITPPHPDARIKLGRRK